MARRKDIDRNGRRPRQGYLRRQENTRNQRKLAIVACEGTETEPNYLNHLFDALKRDQLLSRESCVIADHRHTDPLGVLNDLLSHETPLGLTHKDYEHAWIVIDRDPERTNGGGHTRQSFNAALEKAKRVKPAVTVAWSNPCFEIWFLLHYEYRNTAIDRDELYGLITNRLGRKYEKSDKEIYTLLEGRLETAIRNANNLQKQAFDRGLAPADTNPGTTVHDLIIALRRIG